MSSTAQTFQIIVECHSCGEEASLRLQSNTERVLSECPFCGAEGVVAPLGDVDNAEQTELKGGLQDDSAKGPRVVPGAADDRPVLRTAPPSDEEKEKLTRADKGEKAPGS